MREDDTANIVLSTLEHTIRKRRSASAQSSYTKSLLEAGPAGCAKKFGEEAVELSLAAVSEDEKGLIGEAADVLYHLLVLLAARDVSLDEVMSELARRQRQSGLEEKASRARGGMPDEDAAEALKDIPPKLR